MTFSIDREQLAALYPAFIHTDIDGRVMDFGPSIALRCPEIAGGATLWEAFEPAVSHDSADIVGLTRAGTVVKLRARASGLVLHGSAVRQARGVLLCLAYALSNLAGDEPSALRISDYAKSDPSVAGFVLAKVQETLLSETRDAVSELAALRDAAVAAQRSQAEFLANISHEIRTPLTGIIGFSDLLLDRDDLSDPARHFARRIKTASDLLMGIINDVLDYSALEAGKASLAPHSFRPLDPIEETLQLLQPMADKKGLELGIVLSGPMPAAVQADDQRLRQILLNIVGNAVKLTNRGSVTVTVGHNAATERLEVSVADTGDGIAADQIERLFKRFERGRPGSEHAVSGTGLGLAISKGLVELMGGEIGVRSRLGVGSTFWFTVRAPEVRASQLGTDRVQDGGIHGAKRILIVDDVEANRDLLVCCLGKLVGDVRQAASATDAEALCADIPFDLIITDIHMPTVGGLDLIRSIRRSVLNAGAVIIALSADTTSNNVEACRAAGADDFLRKPIHIPELQAIAGSRLSSQAIGA